MQTEPHNSHDTKCQKVMYLECIFMFMNLCLKTRAGSECGSLLKCKLHFCGNYLSKCMLKISWLIFF